MVYGTIPPRPLTNKDCKARCKICSRQYRYTLTSKGNLLKHLQTSHGQQLKQHKEERQSQQMTSGQLLLTDDVGSARRRQEFRN